MGVEAPQLRAQLEIFASVLGSLFNTAWRKNRGVLQPQPGETLEIIKTKPAISTLRTG